jgi:uracil-DNA glycosylase
LKFTAWGKGRKHARPNRSEILHCKWWLANELDLVKPKLVVAMGATALFALTGQRAGSKTCMGFYKNHTRVDGFTNQPIILQPSYAMETTPKL